MKIMNKIWLILVYIIGIILEAIAIYGLLNVNLTPLNPIQEFGIWIATITSILLLLFFLISISLMFTKK